jgi:hypothetical protein
VGTSADTTPPPPNPDSAKPRSVKEIIDAAIADNKHWENICYWTVCASAVLNILLSLLGALWSHWIFIGSGITGGMFGGSLYVAQKTWRENQWMRLLEIGLSDPKEAASTHKILRDAIVSHVKKEKK